MDMMKIVFFLDIYGNIIVLEVVLVDVRQLGVDEYWFLGDIFMLGIGCRRILDLLV